MQTTEHKITFRKLKFLIFHQLIVRFLSDGVILLNGNARPRASGVAQHLESFGWEQMNHSPYSPELAPRGFGQLETYIKCLFLSISTSFFTQ